MKLDYGTQISPVPIVLSIGTIRKPKLIEIATIGFEKFNFYELLLKSTPEFYYTKLKYGAEPDYWENLSEETKMSMTLYDVILAEEELQIYYTEIFNFFFVEKVIFQEGFFIILKSDADIGEELDPQNIRGVIHPNIFMEILHVLQQICNIADDSQETEPVKYKNKLAQKLHEKMMKAQKETEKNKKADPNYTIPNIISKVASMHPSLNYTNIWELTIYQLVDAFNCLQVNAIYEINATRVSVWGDEKKTFDESLWYKNTH